MLLVTLNLVGLVGLFLGARALIRNARSAQRSARPRWMQNAAFAVGGLLAATSVLFVYPLGEGIRVVGFPFTAAFYEDGSDFIGHFTIPAYALNAAFWFLCPQFVLRLARKRTRRRAVR